MSENPTDETHIQTDVKDTVVRHRIKSVYDSSKAVFDKTKLFAASPQLYVPDHSSKLINIIALLCIFGGKNLKKKIKNSKSALSSLEFL
jgi:hypothetical protein